MGCGNKIFLDQDLIRHLQQHVIFFSQGGDLDMIGLWSQGWKKSRSLGLHGDWVRIWDEYVVELKKSHIHLWEEQYSLFWISNKT